MHVLRVYLVYVIMGSDVNFVVSLLLCHDGNVPNSDLALQPPSS